MRPKMDLGKQENGYSGRNAVKVAMYGERERGTRFATVAEEGRLVVKMRDRETRASAGQSHSQ